MSLEQWGKIRVGMTVKVMADQSFPSDLIILKSSNKSGICYVETKNLDGETNLKHKAAIKDI